MSLPDSSLWHSGVLVRRYKRFLADVVLDGEELTVHCPNPGSMLGMATPGSRVLLSHSDNPKRKLAWTWELVQAPHSPTWVGCNTMRANAIIEHYLQAGMIPGLQPDPDVRREMAYGQNSRIDLYLPTSDTYVEVKNTTLAVPPGHADTDRSDPDLFDVESSGNLALFPDSVSARAAKHMTELTDMVKEGHRAVVVFLVHRGDCDSFAPARGIDSNYAQALEVAMNEGVEAIAVAVAPSPKGYEFGGLLPFTSS